jgi:hypothetical protein
MPPIITEDQVSSNDLENLRASGLTDRTIIANKLRTAGAQELFDLLHCEKEHEFLFSGALVFPYRNLQGEVNCYCRARPLRPRTIQGKDVKYESPKGVPPRPYFPAGSLDKLKDGKSPVYITEGEKKALALSQLALGAIGLGGVYGWKVKDEESITPELQEVPWQSRQVFIIFDYDEKEETRDQTNKAASHLAKLLTAAGATVCIVQLPPGRDGGKQGVDDYLVARGIDAFHDLVASARLTFANTQNSQNSQKAADVLIKLVRRNCDLWHSPDGTGYATIKLKTHQEHVKLRSATFRQWAGKAYYDQSRKIVGTQAVQDAIGVLEGQAKYDGEEHPVFLRVAEHDGAIYLDLGTPTWEVVHVSEFGWNIIENLPPDGTHFRCPVRFRRTKGMLPLPMPVEGGNVNELMRFINCDPKCQPWELIKAWLFSTFRPTGPFPVLKLAGEQGSAKSSGARVLRRVIDPHTADLRRPSASSRDLMIAASNNWILALDNLSYIDEETSDTLCCIATGGTLGNRQLYTDDDETLLTACRPIILNGIEDVGGRSDLASRSIFVELPLLKETKDEVSFWQEFTEAHPRILGAFLTAVSAALGTIDKVRASNTSWSRMADFEQWTVAGEEALQIKPGAFLKGYESNRKNASQLALEACPVVSALINYLKCNTDGIRKTATELLGDLSTGQDTRRAGWPKNARALSGMLTRLAPNLRHQGYQVEQVVKDNQKFWVIKKGSN